jgi:hypothetical protein
MTVKISEKRGAITARLHSNFEAAGNRFGQAKSGGCGSRELRQAGIRVFVKNAGLCVLTVPARGVSAVFAVRAAK